MTREQIRQAADILRETVSARDYAALIGLPINRTGFTQCPFHSGDHTGSLRLYDGRRGWHCFGCGASGDVLELAKRYFSLTFPQAIAKVASDAGIALPGIKMTYQQTQKVREAQERKLEREQDEAIAEKAEEEFWPVFDDWLYLDRKFQELDKEISKQIKLHPVTADEEPLPYGNLVDEFFDMYAAREAAYNTIQDIEIRRIRA